MQQQRNYIGLLNGVDQKVKEKYAETTNIDVGQQSIELEKHLALAKRRPRQACLWGLLLSLVCFALMASYVAYSTHQNEIGQMLGGLYVSGFLSAIFGLAIFTLFFILRDEDLNRVSSAERNLQNFEFAIEVLRKPNPAEETHSLSLDDLFNGYISLLIEYISYAGWMVFFTKTFDIPNNSERLKPHESLLEEMCNELILARAFLDRFGFDRETHTQSSLAEEAKRIIREKIGADKATLLAI